MATADQIPSELTLEIESNLSPDGFLAASRNFFGYVEEISEIVSDTPAKMEWQVKVREGSNLLAMEPTPNIAPEAFGYVFAKVRHATQRLLEGDIEGAGLTERALTFIRGLAQVTERGTDRTIIRLWVERRPIEIQVSIANAIQEYWRSDYTDYGTIDGRLEAIQDSAGLQLRVRDAMYQTLVKCILTDNLLGDAFNSFRKRVEITGLIHYRSNGRPISITVEQLTPLPDDSELPSHGDVRGILAA